MSALSVSHVDLASFAHPATRPESRAQADVTDRTATASRSAEFPRLVASHVPQLQLWARRLTNHQADADDLVQETCRRALEARGKFLPGSNLRAWMMSILRNHHIDRLRHNWREITSADGLDAFAALDGDDPAADAPPEPTWSQVTERDVADALASLPSVFADAYSLHAVSGLSYNDIATRLGIPAATVGTRLRRARLRLRRFLEQRLAQRQERRWD